MGQSLVPAQTIPVFDFVYVSGSAVGGEGRTFTNKDLVPRAKSFFFFFDADCEHCQHAMANLNLTAGSYKHTAFYLVTLDDPAKATKFLQQYGSHLVGRRAVTLLHDKSMEFVNRFKPRKYPSMFLFSADGKLLDYEDNEESMFRFSKFME
jgi:hypothetical protein